MGPEADILVVGPGAIGGVLAARWVEAGKDVRLLGRRPGQASALARRGFSFVGTSGRARLIRRGLRPASRPAGPCSAVFLCVKSRDIAAAARAARPWVGPKTCVVCLQNGLRHAAAVRRAFGPGRTVVGVCYVAAERLSLGRVAHNGGRDIHLARYPGNEAALKAASALLRAAGWSVSVEGSEDSMLWTKLCFNAAGNPLGAVCAASNGDLARDPPLQELSRAALDEALTVARKAGHRIDARRMRRLFARTYPLDSRQRNSMLQDLQARRRTEIDAIVGPVLDARRKTGAATPILNKLSWLVKRLERLP